MYRKALKPQLPPKPESTTISRQFPTMALSVEEMAEVQQEGEQSDLGQTGLAGDQRDGQKLAGAGVDDDAHE